MNELINKSGLQKLLGKSQGFVDKAIQDGKLPEPQRVPGRRGKFWDRYSIQRFIVWHSKD